MNEETALLMGMVILIAALAYCLGFYHGTTAAQHEKYDHR